jgi:beta-xylosidase
MDVRQCCCLAVLGLAVLVRSYAAAQVSFAAGGPARLGSTVQSARSEAPARRIWGDLGNGWYANPILPGDFSDLDAIRVGQNYYAISSTMQYSPGMAVLQSHDLVNWTIIGHVVPDLTALDPQLNWDKMSRAGRGIWGGAIRYHDNRFWVYFGTPDQGIFMSTALTPAGPWSQVRRVLGAPGWDDPCPFWDEDGQAYLVTTHFAPEGPSGTTYNIHLFRMTASGDGLESGPDRIIHRSNGSEANKLYKINGLYYHYYSEVRREGRAPMMERARSLDGPWESHQLMHVHGAIDKEPNQGGLVELPSGQWYFLTHQGQGDWEGRAGVLLPVTWIGGWPVVGRVGGDGIGRMIWGAKKPVPGFPRTNLAASDSFKGPALRPEWEWNYQPRPDTWSLTEHPGSLRMRAFPPLKPGDFHTIPNVLRQRSFRTSHNEVTVKLDLSGMVDGQQAGLAHFAKGWCSVSVLQRGNLRALQYDEDGSSAAGTAVTQNIMYLRSEWDFEGRNRFYYSLDGRSYEAIGGLSQLTWGFYRGDRIGLYTSNSSAASGFIDIESFEYRIQL